MKLSEIMDDLSGRFLMHLPPKEASDSERLFFQVEEAHWFYEDYYRRKYNLPYLSLRDFTLKLIIHSRYASNVSEIDEEFKKFLKYKKTVPVFGALIFNTLMTKILLVKGFGPKRSFTFPRGKICRAEGRKQCAVREVFEEVGYDIKDKVIQKICLDMGSKSKESKLFIVLNVPEKTKFETKTRNEIKEIKWTEISFIEKAPVEALSYVKSYIKDIKAVVKRIDHNKITLDRKRIKDAMYVP